MQLIPRDAEIRICEAAREHFSWAKGVNVHWPAEVLGTLAGPTVFLGTSFKFRYRRAAGQRNLHRTFTIIVSLELDCAQAPKNSFLSLFLFFQSNSCWRRRDTRRLPSTSTKPKWWAYRAPLRIGERLLFPRGNPNQFFTFARNYIITARESVPMATYTRISFLRSLIFYCMS